MILEAATFGKGAISPQPRFEQNPGSYFILEQMQPKKHAKADLACKLLVSLLKPREKSAAPCKYSAVEHSSAALGLLALHIEVRTTQNNWRLVYSAKYRATKRIQLRDSRGQQNIFYAAQIALNELTQARKVRISFVIQLCRWAASYDSNFFVVGKNEICKMQWL